MPTSILRTATALVCLLAISPALADEKPEPTMPTTTSSGSVGSLFRGIFGGDSRPYIDKLSPNWTQPVRGEANQALSLALERSKGFGLVPPGSLGDYVNDVLRRLAERGLQRPVDMRAFVTAGSGLNALSAPDGGIFLSYGLLQNFESEDELAAVLAHEMAHVVYAHHDTDWFVKSQYQILAVTSLAREAGQQLLKNTPQGTAPKIEKWLGLGVIALQVSEAVLNPAWTREQEDEADRLGMDILIRAGYNPEALVSVLQKMGAWEAHLDSSRTMDRPEPPTTPSADTGGLLGMVAGQMQLALGDALHELGKTHYPAEQRIESVLGYLDRAHPNVDFPEAAALPWHGSPRHPIAALLANYAAANEARKALEARDLKQAIKLATTSVSDPTRNDVMPRMTFMDIRGAQGDQKAARSNIELARASPEPAWVVYEALLKDAYARRRWNDAEALISEAEGRLGPTPLLIPERIRVYKRTGREQEATQLAVDCAVAHKAIVNDCAEASNGAL